MALNTLVVYINPQIAVKSQDLFSILAGARELESSEEGVGGLYVGGGVDLETSKSGVERLYCIVTRQLDIVVRVGQYAQVHTKRLAYFLLCFCAYTSFQQQHYTCTLLANFHRGNGSIHILSPSR